MTLFSQWAASFLGFNWIVYKLNTTHYSNINLPGSKISVHAFSLRDPILQYMIEYAIRLALMLRESRSMPLSRRDRIIKLR